MSKPSASEAKRFILFFGVFFMAVSVGQYLFVQHQIRDAVSKQLSDYASSLNQAVDYRNTINLKAYHQASADVGVNYFVVLSDGSVLDIGLPTGKGLLQDLIPEVTSPILNDQLFLHPVKINYTIAAAGTEVWWIFARKLDRGVLILGISEFDLVSSPESALVRNIEAFGTTVESARHVNTKAIDNAVQDWAVITNEGRLTGGSGRIPLRTDPMALGRIPAGVQERLIEGAPYLNLYTPLTDPNGKSVGTIIVSQDISHEIEALHSVVLFNAVIGGVSFIVFLILAIRYSTKHEAERREIKERFQHYFSPQIMEAILRDPEKLQLGGLRREVTILFSDIRSFTSLSEKLAPQQLTRIMQEYFNAMTEEVFATEGIVDKYIGDAIMAFWGAPIEQPDQADRAVTTAINMAKRLEKLKEKWASEGLPVFDIGIGINLGVATVGNFGSMQRFDYTLVGDAVNAASRIEELNKKYGSRIIIAGSTKDQLTINVETKNLGTVLVKGKEKPIQIFEVSPG